MKIKDITETQVGTISGSTRGPDGQPLYTMKDSNGVETKVPGKDIHTDPSGKGVTVAATGVPSGTPVNSSQPTLENGEGEENSEQVIKLANAGHEPEEIAQHLGMDINDVYTIVSNFSGGDNIHPETDPDLIGSGQNVDVGGDATDNWKDRIVDKEFEKANRNSPGQGTRSPIAEKRLPESDELMKWLTIAGIK